MEEKGLVINSSEKEITVKVIRVSQCGHNCADCGGGCDTSSLELKFPNKVNAKTGDVVILESETKAFMKNAYLVYGIPLMAIVIGVVIGINGWLVLLNDLEINGILIGLIFMFLSAFILKWMDNRFKSEDHLKVKSKIVKN